MGWDGMRREGGGGGWTADRAFDGSEQMLGSHVPLDGDQIRDGDREERTHTSQPPDSTCTEARPRDGEDAEEGSC